MKPLPSNVLLYEEYVIHLQRQILFWCTPELEDRQPSILQANDFMSFRTTVNLSCLQRQTVFQCSSQMPTGYGP